MPSWKTHQKWGGRILNFSSRQIDQIIDGLPGLHDAGRYDKDAYWLNMEMLKHRYPGDFDKAFKYYILHHILDVIEQKLISYFSHCYLDSCRYNIIQFVFDTMQEFEIPWDTENVEKVKEEIISYFNVNSWDLKELILDIITSEKFKRRVYVACRNKFPYLDDLSESMGRLCIKRVEKIAQTLEAELEISKV